MNGDNVYKDYDYYLLTVKHGDDIEIFIMPTSDLTRHVEQKKLAKHGNYQQYVSEGEQRIKEDCDDVTGQITSIMKHVIYWNSKKRP